MTEPRNGAASRIELPDAPAELAQRLEAGRAVAWDQPLTIDTYAAGEPSRYPMYLDQRVYQGSSGKVYPIPFTESVATESAPHDWQAVHLENAYVRVVVLPQLGGRIHIGYDKTTGFDFFYRNNVIKPALVGLAGPWISGGVEFNWPQHHRPATYLPVETVIEHGDDGSVTVWCHDHDPFARMSAQHGIRLHADSSVVEVVVRLHNRTADRQTFLWWANVAARVHDDYQAFFPEDVRYVADHARRALTSFPAADRPYYGVDYAKLAEQTPGADHLDWYRNIPVPTSYMIVDSHDDFFGGYDHAAGAGFVHWAERRVSPGKKMWTWGNAPFGHAWDAHLTDADGPYVELMAGVYTDNQPDFTWLMPGETKTFTQHWYPIPAIGVAHQATTDAALHVDREGTVSATAAVTSRRQGVRLAILTADGVVAEEAFDLEPGQTCTLASDATADAVTAVELRTADGRVLVRWEPKTFDSDEEPWLAEEPPAPGDIDSVDELYLTGVHLAQYRHPTRSPLTYWNAALERDPGDVRTNIALADRDYRAGRYERALERIELAMKRLTRRNANPQDAEAFYLHGLVLHRLGRETEARRAWGKAMWDARWAGAAGLALAQSYARTGDDCDALRVLDELDAVAGHDTRCTALRVMLLRRRRDADGVEGILTAALAVDPLDATLRHLAEHEIADTGVLIDVALDLRDAGEAEGALALLAEAAGRPVNDAGNHRPIAHYLAAQILDGRGDAQGARAERRWAQQADRTRAFPAGLDALDALTAAIAADPADAVARQLRGQALYDLGRRGDAASDWDAAVDLGSDDVVLLRNAAVAAYNVQHDDEKAWRLYARALELAPDDARLLYERDQLAVRLGRSSAERIADLQGVEDLVLTRDDLTIEYVQLLVATGDAARGREILLGRPFQPWEGGEGQALAAWDAANEALGLGLIDPPASLGEARPQYVPPVARHESGETDYFATSLPDLLLFHRQTAED